MPPTSKTSKQSGAPKNRDPYKICRRCGRRNYERTRRCPQCHRPYSTRYNLFPLYFIGAIVALIIALMLVK